jgi:outer membrane biosynthesis protein TonB
MQVQGPAGERASANMEFSYDPALFSFVSTNAGSHTGGAGGTVGVHGTNFAVVLRAIKAGNTRLVVAGTDGAIVEGQQPLTSLVSGGANVTTTGTAAPEQPTQPDPQPTQPEEPEQPIEEPNDSTVEPPSIDDDETLEATPITEDEETVSSQVFHQLQQRYDQARASSRTIILVFSVVILLLLVIILNLFLGWRRRQKDLDAYESMYGTSEEPNPKASGKKAEIIDEAKAVEDSQVEVSKEERAIEELQVEAPKVEEEAPKAEEAPKVEESVEPQVEEAVEVSKTETDFEKATEEPPKENANPTQGETLESEVDEDIEIIHLDD